MPLERAAGIDSKPWLLGHVAGLVCMVLGSISLIWAGILTMQANALFAQVPAPWLTVPLLVGAIASGAVSVLRKEGAWGLAVAGIAMAAAALALGWILILLAVMAVTLLCIYVLSEIM